MSLTCARVRFVGISGSMVPGMLEAVSVLKQACGGRICQEEHQNDYCRKYHDTMSTLAALQALIGLAFGVAFGVNAWRFTDGSMQGYQSIPTQSLVSGGHRDSYGSTANASDSDDGYSSSSGTCPASCLCLTSSPRLALRPVQMQRALASPTPGRSRTAIPDPYPACRCRPASHCRPTASLLPPRCRPIEAGPAHVRRLTRQMPKSAGHKPHQASSTARSPAANSVSSMWAASDWGMGGERHESEAIWRVEDARRYNGVAACIFWSLIAHTAFNVCFAWWVENSTTACFGPSVARVRWVSSLSPLALLSLSPPFSTERARSVERLGPGWRVLAVWGLRRVCVPVPDPHCGGGLRRHFRD